MNTISLLWQADHRGFPESEDASLALIDSFFPSSSGHFPHGRGHDCVELAGLPGTLALSSDMFLEGAHFSRVYFTPAEVGAKALTVAVSDLAAAGARPLGFSLGLGLPDGIPVRALEDILRGMSAVAVRYGIALTGGDLARSDRLFFSLCVWGEGRSGEESFLRRRAAQPGDHVFLVGEAGLARLGLFFLERMGRQAEKDWPLSAAAHLSPQALVEEGGKIALLAHTLEHESARIGLMDVSDGLARDLPRLLGGAGMELDLSGLSFPEELRRGAEEMRMEPEDVFLAGGEDYALLGSCPDGVTERLRAVVPGVRFLGRVTQGQGIVRKDGKPLPGGFDHFSAASDGKKEKECSSGGPCRATTPAVARDREKIAQAVRAMIQLGGQAWESDLMAGFNGNISCRVRLAGQGGECCVITRSGAAKGRLEPEDFLVLSLPDGDIMRSLSPASPGVDNASNARLAAAKAGLRQFGDKDCNTSLQSIADMQCSGEPSSESPLHLAVYGKCPESEVILHVHPPQLLALSLAVAPEDFLRLPLPEAEKFRALMAVVPFFPPGSAGLADVVSEAASTHPAVWMQQHGLVAHGADMTAVFALCEELEQLAKVQAMRLSLAGKPTG